jgi:hypothetical protein
MKITHVLSLGLLLFFVACGPSTQLSKSWTDPSVTSATWKPFKKVLVLGLIKDDATRRIVEDKLAAQLPGRAVQSYTYLSAADTVDNQVEAKLIKDGFDGVVYMRLANVEQSTSYVPGTTYGGFYGYRGYGYGGYGTQGYYEQDKTYNVETNVYSLNPPKLLWSGTTASLNPSKLSGTVDDIIAAVKADFAKKGIIAK